MEMEMKWVTDLEQQLHPLSQVPIAEIWIKEIKAKAFEPQIISLGPYHHGKSNLEPMEHHKRRALHRFLERTQKWIQEFGAALEEVVEELMDSYEHLEERWRDKDQFLSLMLMDECFLLELINTDGWKDYPQYDPVFSERGVMNRFYYLIPGMLMVENQVPLLAQAQFYLSS